jgi:S1-C subfamily serine protease
MAIVQTREQIDIPLWVLESEDRIGTAFVLEGFGLISCAHCIGPNVVAYQPSEVQTRYRVTVTHRCDHRDLVRLQIDTPHPAAFRASATPINIGDRLVAAGFGNYASGATSRLINGHVTASGVRSAINVFYSDHRVFGGHSGGPALDSEFAVVGIVQRGVTDAARDQETTILPIALVSEIPAVPPVPSQANLELDGVGEPGESDATLDV